jgi:DNA repair photolyase
VKSRETDNPTNRFHSQSVEYDDGESAPPSNVTLIEDQSRSILSENDSPDLGFRWSANPYRGCQSACAYCLAGDTPILMGDGRTRRLADLKRGDEIYGTKLDGRYRYYTRTRVLDHWATLKLAFRVVLADGTELVASGDHRFLTDRGWKCVAPVGGGQRPHLTTNNRLVGTGKFAKPFPEDDSYRRGYLCGMLRGDAHIRTDTHVTKSGRCHKTNVARLALADFEGLDRTRAFLEREGIETRNSIFQPARPGYREIRAITASSKARVAKILELIAFPDDDDDDSWHAGFLAGIFDAEGSHSDFALRIVNSDPILLHRTLMSFARFGFDAILEGPNANMRPVYAVRPRGGFRERLRFFHLVNPAISRKWNIEGQAIKDPPILQVVRIEPIGLRQLFDITTGTSDFIANGVVSHNCYARPTHEYLDLGAGTDFDTKIVVKRKAPELLRAAFDKPSWKGELVMFSGVTDCYQPTEKSLELTRRCLEVCLEYRNPVSVISKHALVERDIELFLALAKEARFGLAVSLAFTDNELSRQIEPWAASPDRRFRVIETMAKAGVPVGVMCAPIIPGVNDSQLVGVIERAAAAGAEWAAWTLLRLPGAVKEVFEDRIRVALPLAADKIMHRIRETRGGALYKAEFHTRGRGEGRYAETIAAVFDATCARLGLNRRERDKQEGEEPTTFRRPPKPTNQLSLF